MIHEASDLHLESQGHHVLEPKVSLHNTGALKMNSMVEECRCVILFQDVAIFKSPVKRVMLID